MTSFIKLCDNYQAVEPVDFHALCDGELPETPGMVRAMNNDFAKILESAMETFHMDQIELANQFDVPSFILKRWLSRETVPRPKVQRQIVLSLRNLSSNG